jgi:hypothetical protein
VFPHLTWCAIRGLANLPPPCARYFVSLPIAQGLARRADAARRNEFCACVRWVLLRILALCSFPLHFWPASFRILGVPGRLPPYDPVLRFVTWRVLPLVINQRERANCSHHAMNTIRCPYCVENGAFKPMTSQASGDWWICQQCGHLSLPSKRLFECTCSKCTIAPTSLRDRSLGQNVRSRLQLLYRGVRSLVQQWR